ncbi:MAG: acetyl-CoA C-acyltransferase, partial [archaeon]|nr:acetyl-CoA C-acyltransferase [archaeon]
AIRGALEKSNTSPEQVDHVVMGYALQTCAQSIYGAHHAGLQAGVPQEVPMLTLSRICGSGIQSIISGAQMIQLGEANTVVSGGMENLSQAPHVLRGARQGWKLGRSPPVEDYMMTNLQDMTCGLFMAQTSDELCRRKNIDRESIDEFAALSHQRTANSIDQNVFEQEIVSVTIPSRRGDIVITHKDEDHVVRNTTKESLASLPTAFGKESFVTAGNASGVVDGAAAVVIKSSSQATRDKDTPLARIVSWGIVGLEPDIMAYGPVPASRKALERANMKIEDIDRWEINEAFAGQAVACIRDLGLDVDKVNVNGGAVGLGHPLAATGTRLVLTLAHELKRSNSRFGIATACIGGGQGIAIILESM